MEGSTWWWGNVSVFRSGPVTITAIVTWGAPFAPTQCKATLALGEKGVGEEKNDGGGWLSGLI